MSVKQTILDVVRIVCMIAWVHKPGHQVGSCLSRLIIRAHGLELGKCAVISGMFSGAMIIRV